MINEISKIKDLKRIRYTTSHPIDFSEDLIDVHGRNTKLMPLIHLPVQSGSNKILKEMNRKHTIEDYLEVVKKLKTVNPNIKFSSDFIIGYPGETEKDFNDTLQLIDKVEYINFYSFIYSPRPGTPAAKLKKIDESLAKERLSIFQKKAEEVKMRYRKNLFNKECSVLFENELKDRTGFFGKDEFSNSVIVKSSENLKGKIKKVSIINGNHNTLFGSISKKENKRDFAA